MIIILKVENISILKINKLMVIDTSWQANSQEFNKIVTDIEKTLSNLNRADKRKNKIKSICQPEKMTQIKKTK
jgi:hypothetical protein